MTGSLQHTAVWQSQEALPAAWERVARVGTPMYHLPACASSLAGRSRCCTLRCRAPTHRYMQPSRPPLYTVAKLGLAQSAHTESVCTASV